MAELQIGGKTLVTQTGTDNPVLGSGVSIPSGVVFPFFIDSSTYQLSNSIKGKPVIAAWAVFDGTSDTGSNAPQTIEDSFNISSITRYGTNTGMFVVNFSITMNSTAYLLTGHCEGLGYTSPYIQFDSAAGARTTTSCGIRIIDANNAYKNAPRSGFIIVSESWT